MQIFLLKNIIVGLALSIFAEMLVCSQTYAPGSIFAPQNLESQLQIYDTAN